MSVLTVDLLIAHALEWPSLSVEWLPVGFHAVTVTIFVSMIIDWIGSSEKLSLLGIKRILVIMLCALQAMQFWATFSQAL